MVTSVSWGHLTVPRIPNRPGSEKINTLLKLCASRAFVLVTYPSQSHEMLFDAHTRCFAALGGIPRRGIYDNMKTAADKVKAGKSRLVNARFAAMASHYLFDTDFCNVASGWEKGVVEKNSRTVAGGSGKTPVNAALPALRSRMPGCWNRAVKSGRRIVIRIMAI